MPAIALGTGNTILNIMTQKLINGMNPENSVMKNLKQGNVIEWLSWGWSLLQNGEGSLQGSNVEGETTMK